MIWQYIFSLLGVGLLIGGEVWVLRKIKDIVKR